MRYHVTHTTTYAYGEPVAICHNQVHLTPREAPRQSCQFHRLRIHPLPSTSGRRTDYFGNPLNYFSIHEAHRKLTLHSVCKVHVKPRGPILPEATAAWESVVARLPADLSAQGLATYQYVFASPRVPLHDELRRYARQSFPAGRPVLHGVLDLTARVHADFKYDATATGVHTPLMEAFEARHGVCQDFAHIQIGCLRSLGLAARYVSGYLLTQPPPGRPRLVGADASHAWLSVFCGAAGWVDVDPTNDVVPDLDHITLAWGRDYSDVCPIEGVFVGGGSHRLTVSVNVEPLEAASQP